MTSRRRCLDWLDAGGKQEGDPMADERKEKGFSVNDRRWWLDEKKLEQLAVVQPETRPHYVQEIEERLQEKEKLLREYIDAHKASKADMDGVRRRLEGELERRLDAERVKVAGVLLELLDGLERLEKNVRPGVSMEDLAAGIELLGRAVQRQLDRLGLEKIPAEGGAFDPKLMEAMATEPVEAERENQVLEVLRSGYRLKGQLVRPAGVKVGVRRQG